MFVKVNFNNTQSQHFRQSKSVPRIRNSIQPTGYNPANETPTDLVKIQVRRETLQKILSIRRKKRLSESSQRRIKTIKEFQQECKEFKQGAETADEAWKKFTLKNEFYMPLVNYQEDELLDSRAIMLAKNSKVEQTRRIQSQAKLNKRFSSMAQIISNSKQRFSLPKASNFVVIRDLSEPNTRNPTRAALYNPQKLAQTGFPTARMQFSRSAATSPNRIRKRLRSVHKIERLIENCRNLEQESGQYEGKIELNKERIGREFVNTTDKVRVYTSSEDETSIMNKLRAFDCYWELRRKKLERMLGNYAYNEDFMKIIEREECAKYKNNRDRFGVMVNKMIKEKNKRETIKNTIKNNVFKTYADKFIQSKIGN